MFKPSENPAGAQLRPTERGFSNLLAGNLSVALLS